MDQRNDASGLLLVLAATVLWGTVGPAQVLADSPASPPALGGARILTGGLVLAALTLATARRAARTLTRVTWGPLLAASAATGVFQAAYMTSVARTGAAVATAVALGIAPVATGACERVALGARLTRGWTAGTACAVAGCALMMAPDGGARIDPSGVALGALAGCCFGVYTVSAKLLIGRGADMKAAVSVTLLAGGLVLSPWVFAEPAALVSARSLAVVAWLGPVTAALAYVCFVVGLRRVTAATAGTLALAEPLVATALAVVVLGERMSAPVAAGSVLLLGGLVIVSVPRRTGPPSASSAPSTRTVPAGRHAGARPDRARTAREGDGRPRSAPAPRRPAPRRGEAGEPVGR